MTLRKWAIGSILAAMALAAGTQAARTAETKSLARTANWVEVRNYLDLKLFLEELVPGGRETLDRVANWVKGNKYSDLKLFLEALPPQGFDAILESLKAGPLDSAPGIPAIPSPLPGGQKTALTFPFDGEMFVVQGNEDMVSHLKGTGNVYAWDFVVMRSGRMLKGNSGRNDKYFAWNLPVLAPAAGTVVEIMNDNDDHPPMTTKLNHANFVKIDHGNGEFSRVYHLQKGSVVVKPGDHVERGQPLGRVGDSGISLFPHIHYQLDRAAGKKTEPMRAEFVSYFVRENDATAPVRFVVSGVPAKGEFVRNTTAAIP